MDKRDFLKKGAMGGAALLALGTSSEAQTVGQAYKGWQITWSGWSFAQGCGFEIGSWIAKKPNSNMFCYSSAGDLSGYNLGDGAGVLYLGGQYCFDRGFYGFASGPMREKAAQEAYQRLLATIDKVESGELKP